MARLEWFWVGFSLVTAWSCKRIEPTKVTPSSGAVHSQQEGKSAGSPLESADEKSGTQAEWGDVPLGQYGLHAAFQGHLSEAPKTYAGLEQSLRPHAPEHRPRFSVQEARNYRLLRDRLSLDEEQVRRLEETGFIALSVGTYSTMGGVYSQIWQADLPVMVTTDSILHAFHRSFDDSLMKFERNDFFPSYLAFVSALRKELGATYTNLPSSFRAAARDLDLYTSVALSLLGPSLDALSPEARKRELEKDRPDLVVPLFASREQARAIVDAVYQEKVRQVELFGRSLEVDFTQFQPRGHYTQDVLLERYFRAVMWMGRADTGFLLRGQENERHGRGALAALLMTHLAREAGRLESFAQTQRAIDFFVGASNGLSLVDLAEVLGAQGISSIHELASADLSQLTDLMLNAAGPDRVLSQGLLTAGPKSPPPTVFQLSSQRFTLDGYVHEQTSFDEVKDRLMVRGLDVFAALGNDEATRLLRPDLEQFQFSGEMAALRQTIERLPRDYWEQNLYTRWFDALKTLHEVPDAPGFAPLFSGRAWQRKQLQTQLASWAELRRDTILYAAQTYASISCDFADAYVEPYPEFFEKMGEMAAHAHRVLPNDSFFKNFENIMNKLERIARLQLEGKEISKHEHEFLMKLVKLEYRSVGCGSVPEWTGWYSSLFVDGDPNKYEPVVADVFTDPNNGQVLNAATTGAQLAVLAIETPQGPRIFLGPISGYREFLGSRMTDEQWKEQLRLGRAPEAPRWTNDFHAGNADSPRPHR